MTQDKRDKLAWVTLELTRPGELLVDEGTLEKSLRKHLKLSSDHPVFVPAITYSKRGRTVTIHLMEGYAFVASGLDETKYFALERGNLVSQVLSSANPMGMRHLQVIPDSYIQELRVKLQEQVAADICEGMRCKVLEGVYKELEGFVLGIQGGSAILRVKLRSLDLIATVPRVFLEVCAEGGGPQEMPTARFFHDPVIRVMGRLAHYRPHTGVSMERIFTEVLHEVDLDPEKCGWTRRGREGIYRRIGWAFRNQRVGYTGKSRHPLCLQLQKSLWGLTDEGVKIARVLNGLGGYL